MASDYYEVAIRREVEQWAGAAVSFSVRAKHRQVVLSYGGSTRFVVFPDSPSDSRRGHLNCLRDVRRELNALGAAKAEKLASEKPRKRSAAKRPASRQSWAERVEAAPVKASPFEVLAQFVPAEPVPEPEPAAKLTWWRRMLNLLRPGS